MDFALVVAVLALPVRGEGAPRAAGHGRGCRLPLGGVQLDAGLGSIGLRHLWIFDGREVEEISAELQVA